MRHFSQTKWHRLKIALVFVGIFFAGFFAWKDEHIQVAQKQTEIDRLDRMGGGGKEAQAKIDSLTQANQQLQQKLKVVEQTLEWQTSPWVLTDDQERKLTEALSKIPPGVTYKLAIHVIPGCPQCAGYTNDLGELWKKVPGWEVQGSTNHGLNPLLIGVNVVPDMEGCPPEELQFVMGALVEAGIRYRKVLSKGKLGSGCLVLVGNRPQE